MFNGFLKVVTPPTTEPVSAVDVKTCARVAHTVEDRIIEAWIKAARKHAQDFRKESFVTQTLQAVFDGWPSSPFDLPLGPLQSVSSIKYYGIDDTEYTVDSGDYYVDTVSEVGRVSLNYSVTWPTTTLRPINSVIIQYVAGYGTTEDVPEDVKNAIYIYCTYMFENREGEGGIPKAFYDLLRPARMAVS